MEYKRWKDENCSNSRRSRNEEQEDKNEHTRRRLMFRGSQIKMGKIQEMSFRCLNYSYNDLVIPFNENIFVIDNDCDQKIVNINAFLIEYFVGVQFNVGGALNSMKSTKLDLDNYSYTLVTLPNNVKVIFKINQAFLVNDPTQTEALLQPHQVRAFGIIVDDCASRHLSTS